MATTVVFAGKEYTGKELTDDEQKLLFGEVYNVLAEGNDFLGSLFKQNEQSILGAAQVAKEKFDAPYAGLMAGDGQIGVQLIRPGHIMRSTSGTENAINTWDSEGVVTGAFVSGADNWIGFGANNATPVNIDKEALLLPLGLAFRQGQPPAVQELRFQIGGTIYPTVVVGQAADADNPNRVRAVRFSPLLWQPKDTVLATIWSETGGRQEMKLLGLTFGLGRFLRNTSYSSIAT